MKYTLNQGEIELNLDKIDHIEWPLSENSLLTHLVNFGILIPVPEKKWPIERDIVWVLASWGSVIENYADNYTQEEIEHMKRNNSIFRTEKEAQEHLDEINVREV